MTAGAYPRVRLPQHVSAAVQWFIFPAYNFAGTIIYTAVGLAEGTLCSMMARGWALRTNSFTFLFRIEISVIWQEYSLRTLAKSSPNCRVNFCRYNLWGLFHTLAERLTNPARCFAFQ